MKLSWRRTDLRLKRGARTHLSLLERVSNAAVACDKVLFSMAVMPWRGQTNGEEWFLLGLKERRVKGGQNGFYSSDEGWKHLMLNAFN